MYFIESNVPFGRISIFMVLVWLVTAGIGLYLLRAYTDRNPLRQRFVRQVGLFEAALAGVGLVLLVFKYFNVPVLEWRLWTYLVVLAWLGYTGYAAWFYTSRLPAIIAATSRIGRGQRPQISRGSRPSGNARTYPANGAADASPREPRQPATTTRREARRERKRRSR